MKATFRGIVTGVAGREDRDGTTTQYSAHIQVILPKGTTFTVGKKLVLTVDFAGEDDKGGE